MIAPAKTKIPFDQAFQAASELRALFDGCYLSWMIAGSIRRREAAVSDVDHVVIPIIAVPYGAESIEPVDDLFGTPRGSAGSPQPQNWMLRRAQQIIAEGGAAAHLYESIGGKLCTRIADRQMGLDYRGIKHEIWMCDEQNLGCMQVIRTGPADFSHEFVIRLRRNGHRQAGGYLEQWSASWNRCEQRTGWFRVPCPDEETYFKAAGYDHVIPPEERR